MYIAIDVNFKTAKSFLSSLAFLSISKLNKNNNNQGYINLENCLIKLLKFSY